MPIRFVGLKELSDEEVLKTQNLAKKYLPKFERHFDSPLLQILIKKKDVEGTRCRYEIKSHLEAPNVRLASDANDWDIAKTLHKALQKLENEIKKG